MIEAIWTKTFIFIPKSQVSIKIVVLLSWVCCMSSPLSLPLPFLSLSIVSIKESRKAKRIIYKKKFHFAFFFHKLILTVL